MNPILISSILSGLLQSSLLVGTAWLLTLAQRRTSAARRSTGYRLTMAAAIALVVIVFGNAALSIVPSHINGDISAQAALPQGPGTIAENSLLHLSGSPVLKTNEPVTAIPLANARRNLSLLLTAGSYLLIDWGVIHKPFVNVPWTTPPIIGHYLVTGGDWKAAVWGVVSILLAMLVYYPFAKAAERQRLKAESAGTMHE